MIIRKMSFAFCLLIAGMFMATGTRAQGGRDHPAYLHALSDLRAARWLLEHTPGDWRQGEDERFAAKEINEAIREIKEAAIDDGKKVDERPMVDARNERGGHLRQTMDYLRKAKEDLAHEEDNNFARGLRNNSIRHIDEAMRGVNKAMMDMNRMAPPPPPPPPPPPMMGGHPAYLHALSDLRAARWLLEHTPGDWRQGEDERFAAREINEAIREIKEAAIDDGKKVDERPMVDARNERGGHLRQAMDFLRKSRQDLEHEEDNNFARGLRNRSIKHIDDAMRGVEKAMHS